MRVAFWSHMSRNPLNVGYYETAVTNVSCHYWLYSLTRPHYLSRDCVLNRKNYLARPPEVVPW